MLTVMNPYFAIIHRHRLVGANGARPLVSSLYCFPRRDKSSHSARGSLIVVGFSLTTTRGHSVT